MKQLEGQPVHGDDGGPRQQRLQQYGQRLDMIDEQTGYQQHRVSRRAHDLRRAVAGEGARLQQFPGRLEVPGCVGGVQCFDSLCRHGGGGERNAQYDRCGSDRQSHSLLGETFDHPRSSHGCQLLALCVTAPYLPCQMRGPCGNLRSLRKPLQPNARRLLRFLRTGLLATALLAAPALPDVQLLQSSADGLRLVVEVDPGLTPNPISPASIAAAGLPRGSGPDHVDLPYLAHLLAAPPGAKLSVRVESLADTAFYGVHLRAADSLAAVLPAEQLQALAGTEPLGILRGVPAHALHVYPWQYDAANHSLRVHTRLLVEVRFDGASAARPLPHADAAGTALRSAFLNPPDHAGWAGPQPARRVAQFVDMAYDPTRPWLKITVSEDGVFSISRDWLQATGVSPADIDPRTFALSCQGQAQPIYIVGAQDGSFDEADELFFLGRYRRAATLHGERDHESEYGPANMYWLTWGAAPGLRFIERDVSPVHEYAPRRWYEATAHFEEDRVFDVLAAAPDTLADRWFWQQPGRWVQAVDADRPGSGIFAGDLTGLYQEQAYDAHITVALQGRLGAAFGEHHTIVSFNNEPIADDYWAGQTSHVISATIPSRLLQARNRVLLQALADRIRQDQLWFNWFRIDYRRFFHANAGFLEAATPATPQGQRIIMEGFADAEVLLFEREGGFLLTGAQAEGGDSVFTITFDDAPAARSAYVAADRQAVKTPDSGQLDKPSHWRSPANDADYVIVTPSPYLPAAERLATHRRRDGLAVVVVASEDIFDEFSHGRFDREALSEFVYHAYHEWRRPPALLLLLGDETWDYRGKYTGDRDQQLIPTHYYLARRRGYSPSDYRLSLVDGDDLLADLSVGRLAVDSAAEADVVVDKIIAYDESPVGGDWRSRSIFAANWHAVNEFSDPLDSMAVRYTEPLGLQSVRLYARDEAPLPNALGGRFLDELNKGALIANFSGHGAAGTMQFLFSTQRPEFDYLSQVRNGPRLPLVLALSCLNGLFVDPHTEGLSELFTEWPAGGAIAYISATAISFAAQNSLLQEGLYSQFFAENQTRFGPALDVAKARMLAAHSSFVDDAQTMQLTGDPAQRLALPPAAEYAAVDLVVADTPVVRGRTIRLAAVVGNNTRLGPAGPLVTLVGRSQEGKIDTLLRQVRAPFAGVDTLIVDWPVTASGLYDLALVVDGDQLGVTVHVVEAPVAQAFLPVEGAVVPALTLQALMPLHADGTTGDERAVFALSRDHTFTDATTIQSPAIAADAGRAVHTFDELPPGTGAGKSMFWRVQVTLHGVRSVWSPARSVLLSPTPGDVSPGVSPDVSPDWQQLGEALLLGQPEALQLDGDAVIAAAAPMLFRPSAATSADGFTVLDLPGAGVLATDGTYLYAKRWFNDASTVYAGTDRFTRIGTGFGGSIRGGYYGALSDSTTPGISATYHRDGYLYSDSGHLFELERIDPVTGHLDTVAVPDGLLDWKTGQVVGDSARTPGQVLHAMITSDGRQIYNVSMSSALGTRVGWGVRVFDVDATGWHLAREFIVPPTETGFTYLFTDGIFADGERLYLIEFDGERRIRAVSAMDGSFVDEWTSDQDVTRVISGQYDWLNDHVWLGDLRGSGLFRYRRSDGPAAGQLTSPGIGPAAAWKDVRVSGSGILLSVQSQSDGRQSDGRQSGGRQGAGWVTILQDSLPTGGSVDLTHIDATRHRHLRLVARIDSAAGALLGWGVNFDHASDLEIADVTVEAGGFPGDFAVAVRNRGLATAAPAAVNLQTKSGHLLATQLVGTLAAGNTATVRFAEPPEAATEALRVWIVPGGGDADPDNDRADVPRPWALTPIIVRTWPQGQRLQNGDVLAAGQAILVQAVGAGQLAVRVDDVQTTADTTWLEASGPRAVLRLPPGRRQLAVQLVADDPGATRGVQLTLDVADELAISSALVVPNPVGPDGTQFTCYVSHAARVAVEIYSISGRRIRRLGPLEVDGGFALLPWDGRDDGGQPLAAGTYLYVIHAAADKGDRAARRGLLVIAP